MKNIFKHIDKLPFFGLLIVAMLMIGSPDVSAQKKEATERDTTASLIIEGAHLESADELIFRLRLLRHSERWSAYANGTYQLVFADQNINVNSDSMSIEFTGTTDLHIYTPAGNEMPIDGYEIMTGINPNHRISIMVVGPEAYEDAKYVPRNDTGIVIGEFRLKGKNGFLMPDRLQWLEPYNFFQACAYKLAEDSIVPPGIVWYEKDDNVELMDSLDNFVFFRDNSSYDEEKFILDFFRVEYEGQKIVDITWKTSSEPFNAGFTLLRGMRLDPLQLKEDVDYTDTIVSYPPNIDFKGTGAVGKGGLYYWRDSVDYRGVDYCYKLNYRKVKRDAEADIYLASECQAVPNAVIYAANATPNPFAEKTEIRFWLEDDCMVDAYVRDVTGREIERLCTNTHYKYNMKQAPHVFEFRADDLAANGLYEVVILAEPINDTGVTNSSAVIKIQLLR